MTQSSQALLDIERAVSRERLKRYMAATGTELSRAIALYEDNVALSEAVFGLLHIVEVAIRNSMHTALSIRCGTQRWYQSAAVPLTQYGQDKIAAAIRDAGGPSASAGKVVAELTFGFWSNLAARSYHWTLWQPCLHRAFPNARLSRPVIHARLESIRMLRNRIAHHEPVLTSRRALYVGSGQYLPLNDLLECAEWLDPELGLWLRSRFRYATASILLDQTADLKIAL